jgi:SpoVK/Ycf46/Vps4 family AAA+-type ATPase
LSGLRELSPRSDVQQRKATRRLSGLVLPADKVAVLNRFIREWRYREKIIKFNVPVRNTLLLYGPSGNGKTAIAECLAGEMQLPFAVTKCDELIGSYLGATSSNLRGLFDWAENQAAVLLFDECDSLLIARDAMDNQSCNNEMKRAVNTILAALDGAPKDTVFVFASNFAEKLDAAFLRRMSVQMHVPAPTVEAKRELIRRLRVKWPFVPAEGEWFEESLRMPSFAECEMAVADAAREVLMREAT